MSPSSSFSLAEFPVHLGSGATAEREPRFTGSMDWYASYAERRAKDGAEGRLVSTHTFDAPWSSWEMHPNGAEVVICNAGAITLHQEVGDTVRTITLRPGEAAINPPGIWHTADVKERSTATFITAGMGTQVRAR